MSLKRFSAATGFALIGCFGIAAALGFVAYAQYERPPIKRIANAGDCKDAGGTDYSSTHDAIPGDGQLHSIAAVVPKGVSRLVGAYVKTQRQGLDPDYAWECMTNPEQPPTPENSLRRRCEREAQDMSVEYCRVGEGNTPSLTCAFVNAAKAQPKQMEIWACWKP